MRARKAAIDRERHPIDLHPGSGLSERSNSPEVSLDARRTIRLRQRKISRRAGLARSENGPEARKRTAGAISSAIPNLHQTQFRDELKRS